MFIHRKQIRTENGMYQKLIKYSVLLSVLLITVCGTAAHFYREAEDKKAQEFDSNAFDNIQYTDEELSLFNDIAFNRDKDRIRKWTTDLKVEIKTPDDIHKKTITEIDSVIAILRPLIAPLKIERVKDNGNVHIYVGVKKVPTSKRITKPIPVEGIAKTNEASDYSWDINHAHIYIGHYSSTQTIMHEFEHILGLEHPIMLYDFYLTIGRSVIPQHYSVYGEWLRFQSMPYYISKQEKTVIRMLYSPEIKPGLQKEVFINKMRSFVIPL